ncbi:MAG TPA: hypothetical protein VFH43_11225, partial [Candidatus Kapabacteria bacterium]|nr:hypothetical protein [Candidatus Kapabacteria bacterium]
MMKILLLLAGLFAFATGDAFAQSRFEPDSISIEYAQCKGDSALADVRLINRGSSLEILDLRFADSNRTWEIYDTLGSYSFIKGAILFAGDTLNLRLRQRGQSTPLLDWYRDTLVTSGAATSDTLLLNARIFASDLQTTLSDTDLGIVLQNAQAIHPFRIWNTGESPHIFSFALTPGWTLEGIANGDTLMAGDTLDASLGLLSTATIGTFTSSLSIGGDCDELPPSTIAVKVVPAHAHWTQLALDDTIRGCDEPRPFAVSLTNSSAGITHISGIGFVGEGQPYWSLGGGTSLPFNLQPGETKELTIIRHPGATSTKLVIQSDQPGSDTLPVTIVSEITRPRILNFRDTVLLNAAPDQEVVHTIEIQNQGLGSYHLTDFQLESSSHWSVLAFDTLTTAGASQKLQVKLVFSGSSSEGDFPAKLTLQGAECDTLLTQVV